MSFYQKHDIFHHGRYYSPYRVRYPLVDFNAIKEGDDTDGTQTFPLCVKFDSSAKITFYIEYRDKFGVHPVIDKVIFSLPLENAARIDNFLLNISNSNYSDFEVLKLQDEHENVIGNISYTDFIPNINCLFDAASKVRATNIEILLSFFKELWNPESPFYIHDKSHAEKILSTIKESRVYQFIEKKFQFYFSLSLHVIDGSLKNRLFEERMTTNYNEFVDFLLKNDINDFIKPEHYNEDNWFLDPEREIFFLAEWNRKLQINTSMQVPIQKYLLHKHNTLTASRISDPRFWKIPVFLHAFSFFLFLACFWNWLNNQAEYSVGLLLAGGISYGAAILMTFLFQKNINLFMPRLMVTLLSSWLLVAGVSELVEAQILINNRLIAFSYLFILLVLMASVFAEVKHFSPYYKSFNGLDIHNIKILPILVFAFNTSVVIGVVLHLLLINSIIRNSNTLSQKVFKQEIQDQIVDIRNAYDEYSVALKKFSSNSLTYLNSYSSTNVTLEMKNDSILWVRSTAKSKNIDVLNDSYNHLINSVKFDTLNSTLYKDLKSYICTNRKRTFLDSIRSFGSKHLNTESINVGINFDTAGKIIKDNLYHAMALDTFFFNRARRIDSLLTIYTGEVELNKKLFFNSDIEKEAKKSKLADSLFYQFSYRSYRSAAIPVNSTFIGEERYVYTDMLMIQVIVVMALGIIGQLIISSTTITEAI